MSEAVAKGAAEVAGADFTRKRIPEITTEDATEAAGLKTEQTAASVSRARPPSPLRNGGCDGRYHPFQW